MRSQNLGIQSNQTNTASMRGDSEIRFLNLQRKGCERGVTTAPSRGHVPVSVQCITHPPFFPAPAEATRAKREAESQPSETPGLMCTSASFSSSRSTMKTCVLPSPPLPSPPLLWTCSPLAPLPIQWAQPPAAFRVSVPYREMQTFKTKLLKKETVLRRLPVFPRSSLIQFQDSMGPP